MASVLFRVDAGARVGLGHLQRCLSLASALRQLDVRCVFLAAGEPRVQAQIRGWGFATRALGDAEPGGQNDSKLALDIAAEERCAAAIVDSYLIDASYLARLRAADLRVMAIDDLAQSPFPCHLLVNGGVQAKSLPYRSLTGDTRFLLGPEYALLREEFSNCPRKVFRDDLQMVMVTMGGADGRNLTPTILESLDSLEGDFAMMAIIGPFNVNRPDAVAAARRCKRPVRLAVTPESVRSFMLEADLAVSAGGQTLYELAATGTPTVAVQAADNQAGNIQGFAAHGAIIPIFFRDGERLSTAITDAVAPLLVSSERRQEMSRAGRRLVDGLGAQRVAAIITEVLPTRESS